MLALIALPVVWFNRVLLPGLTGKTLLPFDTLYSVEPWRSLRPDVVVYNPLIGDLVLQNVPWALHTRRALASGELPLWNPDIFAGAAFLAGGQGGVLYPPAVLLYTLPLADAFGWYIVLHISLAGAGMYVLGNSLGLRRPASLFAAVAFMFGGYVITNATFPQAIATAAWTPLMLAIVERLLQPRGSNRRLWLFLAGAVCVGLQILASHVETSLYGLVTVGAYASARLAGQALRGERQRAMWTAAGLLAMVALGSGLAAGLLVPMVEALGASARVGARSAVGLAELAWPLPQLWTVLLPDLFGNPTQRQWLDVWRLTFSPSATGEPIFWGTKNYVEGGQYVGILTLLLGVVGVVHGRRQPAAIFGGIGLVALLLVLGSPLYLALAVVPGADQLRSPFRWVFPLSLAICMLAGLGLDAILRRRAVRLRRVLELVALGVGVVVLGGVGLSVLVPEPFLKVSQRLVTDPAWAERAFGRAGAQIPTVLPTPQMFWGYESLGMIRLGVVALACGAALALVHRRPGFGVCASIGLLWVDVFSVQGSFFPAIDVSLSPLETRPPVVDAINQREANAQPWRFSTLEHGDEKTFLANAGMYYAWQDVRGYDSIIPRQYALFTQRLGLPADSLGFNRIAPVYNADVLRGRMLDLLNVRYVLTEQQIGDPDMLEVYRDAHIRAYENMRALPRTFVASAARVLPAADQPLERTGSDVVYLESGPPPEDATEAGWGSSRVAEYGLNHVNLDVEVDGPAWVVLADSYAPGWHATAYAADGSARSLEVYRADSALRAVHVPSAGTWAVRFAYQPESVRAGLLVSVVSAVVLVGAAAAALLLGYRHS